MITNQQKKEIHVAAHKAGLISNHDDSAYRNMLKDRYGVNSCLKLSDNQARDLIGILKGMGQGSRAKGKIQKAVGSKNRKSKIRLHSRSGGRYLPGAAGSY